MAQRLGKDIFYISVLYFYPRFNSADIAIQVIKQEFAPTLNPVKELFERHFAGFEGKSRRLAVRADRVQLKYTYKEKYQCDFHE